MMTPLGKGGHMYSRPRRWPRVLAVVVVLLLLAAVGGGAWWLLTRDDGAAESAAPSPSPSCRTPDPKTPTPLPPPSEVEVDVANGTDLPGLATETADDLRAQGFAVAGIGNTERPVKRGVAFVRYRPSQYAEAVRLASFVPGANLRPLPASNGSAVSLWLGPEFDGVVDKEQANVRSVALPTPDPVCPRG